MSNQGEQPTSRRGKIVTAIVATVLTLGAVGFGGAVIVTANANAAAHTQLMAGVKVDGQELGAAAEEDAALDATVEAAARTTRNQELAAADTAAKVAAEQAAAAEAARVQAEADAQRAAQQQATRQQTTTKQATGAESSGAPSGTPLPMVQVTDPNNGQYGQMVPSVDPSSYCAAGSASTINGVPTCD